MTESFMHPFLPTTATQRQEMLAAINVPSVDSLFSDIPERFRNPQLNLPAPLSELELRTELETLARLNTIPGESACFLGGGAYRHYIPSAVRTLLARGELATSYTPYQPEVSQGTLQSTYEFQSMICLLTDMEVANAGMYDGATALAEAALMACRVTGRRKVIVLQTVNPRYREVVNTYLLPQNIQLISCSNADLHIDTETACILVQYPNYFGELEDIQEYAAAAHSVDALLVSSVDPVALALFKTPGELGADVVVGECQPLGAALSYGGPYVGLFACRQKFLRQMPGRIVGKTVDLEGRPGFVLTLQTREQHIRREGATSNICTSEALIATAAVAHLACLGPRGLKGVAELCYHKAHYAANLIGQIDGYTIVGGDLWFKEFVAICPFSPKEINKILLQNGIIGGIDISSILPNGMLLCVTEMNSRAEIDQLAQVLAKASLKN